MTTRKQLDQEYHQRIVAENDELGAEVKRLTDENAVLDSDNELYKRGFQLAADAIDYYGDWHEAAPIAQLIELYDLESRKLESERCDTTNLRIENTDLKDEVTELTGELRAEEQNNTDACNLAEADKEALKSERDTLEAEVKFLVEEAKCTESEFEKMEDEYAVIIRELREQLREARDKGSDG